MQVTDVLSTGSPRLEFPGFFIYFTAPNTMHSQTRVYSSYSLPYLQILIYTDKQLHMVCKLRFWGCFVLVFGFVFVIVF